MTKIFWHNLTAEDAIKKLNSDSEEGLSEKEVKVRQEKFGKNKLPEEKPFSRLKIFFEQFKSPLIYILLIAGIITLILKEYTDSIVIFGAVFLNTIVGFFQENKASEALRKLKKVVKIEAKVIREGNLKIVDSQDLVPGDIFILRPGDKVPADGRIIKAHNLKTNEMALTGEWLPAKKHSDILPKEVSVADRDNMVYMGTIVESGTAKAVVTEIGLKTEMGKVAQMIKETREEKTPLQRKLARLAKIFGVVIMIICLFIFIGGIIAGYRVEGKIEIKRVVEMFETSVAVAVAAIPEGLPVAMTIILAIGMQRILRRKGLVRKLLAAETLGSTSIICVPGDTLIWANSSIKSISTINKNDKAIGIDGQFSLVKKKYRRKYSGEMISIKPVGLPEVEFTPEHPILIAKAIEHHPCIKKGRIIHRPRIIEITEPKWTPALEAKKGDLVLVPRIKRRDAYDRFAIRFKKGKRRKRIRIPLDPELSELLGWYLAEGCYCENKQIIFYFGKNEKENIERVKYLIENKLKLKTYLYEKQTNFCLVFNNADLARFFKNNFGHKAPFKKIPNFILFTTHQNIIHFLRGYLKGDGRIDKYTLRFSTSSQQIAHQLILLLAKIGIRGRLHHNKIRKGIIRGREIDPHDSYDVFINGTQADIIFPVAHSIKYKKRNLVLKDEKFVYFPIKSVKRERKSLEVFNIKTESQTYCLPFIVHNCTDKTATLTEGKMKVIEVLTPHQIFKGVKTGKGNAARLLALKIAALCSEAFIENPKEEKEKWIIRGDPTSRALLLAGLEAGFSKRELEKKFQKIDELPFDPIRKFVANLYQINEKNFVLYICGAPEKILAFSNFFQINEEKEKLTKDKLEILNSKLESLTERGLRVVAVAYKSYDKILKYEKLEDLCNDLVFVGFLALKDPLRKEVKEAIEICRQAGMRPIIVTGDHKLTAKAIAQEIGLKVKEENIIEGKDLDKISDEEFEKKLDKIKIYARVEPRHKMRIIKAWQERGEVVAMTGDGINDAPALKKADIGVALGSGTDVAKEVSDLILLPDSFNIIVAAVEEGRAIIDNIRKVITYLLSDSFCEVILIGGSMIISRFTHQTWILPVTAVQILWTNLIEDGLPGIALAFEPKEKDLMKRKPGGHKIPLLTKEMKVLILIAGLIDDILLLGLFFWLLKFSGYSILHIRSIMFANLAIDTLYFGLCCKSLRRNLWHINPFSNKFFNIALVVSVILLFGALYFPPLQKLLKTEPLYPFDWGLISILTLIDIIFIEATKWYFIAKKKL